MTNHLTRVEAAIKDLQAGKMLILVDDANREDEGDLIFPAENATAENLNFMVKYCSGIVCFATTAERVQQLGLALLVSPEANQSQNKTPFVMSIEAKTGVSTGVSTKDRATTILNAIADEAKPQDLVSPGHVFPLQAKAGGVLERAGHTEGSVDIVRLAGLKPGAVLCEVMNADGTMARGAKLQAFADQHQIRILAIDDIIQYRLTKESVIEETASTLLPLEEYGSFKMTIIREKFNGKEHVVLANDSIQSTKPPLVRIHSACMTGDIFSSQRCDCHQQLHYSLELISKEGGILIYLSQEGRGIGLFNKVKAYALQEKGIDTVEANQQLGLEPDSRRYYMAAHALRARNISAVRLLTNNPHKVADLEMFGITQVERIAMPIFINHHNKAYLEVKQNKLNHVMACDFNSFTGSL